LWRRSSGSAIQSGTGADIIMAIGNWPQLYAESLASSSDVPEKIGNAQGGDYDVSRLVATVGSKWIGVPWTVGGGLIAYRKSWLEEVGYGKKLKAKGRLIGHTAGHTFGDAPSWWYPYLWSWGGQEVEDDGKTVVPNSKETVELIKAPQRPCMWGRWPTTGLRRPSPPRATTSSALI
jgi:multiple sugar transport system substrate-binding protein